MAEMAPVQGVIQYLTKAAESQSEEERDQEGKLLEEVAMEYAHCYDFSSGLQQAVFQPLFLALMTHRFLEGRWLAEAGPAGRLRVVQSLRLLTRDSTYRKVFVHMGGIKVLAAITEALSQEHFQPYSQGPFHLETLTECASIVKKLSAEERCYNELVDAGMSGTLLSLLNTTDPALLPLLMVALIGLATSPEHAETVFAPGEATDTFDLLLRMLNEYDLPYKRLAADLLSLATRRKSARRDLLQVNPFGKILGQLHSGDRQLVQTLLRLLNHMTVDSESVTEICQIGGIPVIVSLLSPSDGLAESILTPGRVAEIQTVCLLMCRMAEDDESAYQMRQCNAVYLLGKLLLHSFCTDPSFQEDAALLKAHLFMTLRFLFSMERNRKVFKRLFPPNLFATFIDVGHYQFGLPQYSDLVQRWDKLSEKAVQSMAAALEDINLFKGDAQRCVRDYAILELLGAGAFGAVYKARRMGGEMLVALKELPLSNVGLFGATSEEKNAGVGTLTSEVEILSQLNHPNIVAYYESFVEDGCLWIVMELVEGLSLLDYTSSLAEKGRRMTEPEIWQVFVGLVMALNHCHTEKRIVHRDLTPGNIVLGHGSEGLRHAKLTDFGLAKQRGGATDVMMQSMVGTMPYTCPEIIQQEGYTEKADIWSLGCVLYHMCMLRGPFEGSNPLQMASKIVEGNYAPVGVPAECEPYSRELSAMVAALLTTDPSRRPSIGEVSAMASTHLLKELTSLAVMDNKLRATLEYERKKRREDKEVKNRKEEAYKRLVSFGRASTSGPPAYKDTSVAAAPALSGLQTSRGGSAKQRLPPLHGGGSGPGSPMVPSSPVVRRLERLEVADGNLEGSIKRIPLHVSSRDDMAAMVGGRETIKINQARLRPVRDPLAQLLHQLHKIVWIEQLPPGASRDGRRRVVVAFKRHLFSARQNAGSIKSLLVKLQAGGPELVEQFAGFGHQDGPDAGGADSALGGRGGHVTYEELRQLIEHLARETGFYEALREEITQR
eukprot:jgi/Tetstr1/436865/TSEL_025641.t1